jgi:hypothetical protein
VREVSTAGSWRSKAATDMIVRGLGTQRPAASRANMSLTEMDKQRDERGSRS